MDALHIHGSLDDCVADCPTFKGRPQLMTPSGGIRNPNMSSPSTSVTLLRFQGVSTRQEVDSTAVTAQRRNRIAPPKRLGPRPQRYARRPIQPLAHHVGVGNTVGEQYLQGAANGADEGPDQRGGLDLIEVIRERRV